jgi:hypothetical protein
MRMNNIYDIDNYCPSENEGFLFDCNVWMYLFCPIGNYKSNIVYKYSTFFKKILVNKSKIFILALTISEFFNSYVRLEYNINQGKYTD